MQLPQSKPCPPPSRKSPPWSPPLLPELVGSRVCELRRGQLCGPSGALQPVCAHSCPPECHSVISPHSLPWKSHERWGEGAGGLGSRLCSPLCPMSLWCWGRRCCQGSRSVYLLCACVPLWAASSPPGSLNPTPTVLVRNLPFWLQSRQPCCGRGAGTEGQQGNGTSLLPPGWL